jgi:hypothetical protein
VATTTKSNKKTTAQSITSATKWEVFAQAHKGV